MTSTTQTTIERQIERDIVMDRFALVMHSAQAALTLLARRKTPAAIHEVRIRLCRFQSTVRNMKRRLAAKPRKRCMAALSGIMDACGAVRDTDVRLRLLGRWLLRAGLENHAQAAALLAIAERECVGARRMLRKQMKLPDWHARSRKFSRNALLLGAHATNEFPRALVGDAHERYRKHLLRLPRATRKMRKLHRLRLRIKDARYFLEEFGPLFGAMSPGEIEQMRALQRTLGDLHDEWSLRKWLRARYECPALTRELLRELKAHRRQLLKRVSRLTKVGVR